MLARAPASRISSSHFSRPLTSSTSVGWPFTVPKMAPLTTPVPLLAAVTSTVTSSRSPRTVRTDVVSWAMISGWVESLRRWYPPSAARIANQRYR